MSRRASGKADRVEEACLALDRITAGMTADEFARVRSYFDALAHSYTERMNSVNTIALGYVPTGGGTRRIGCVGYNDYPQPDMSLDQGGAKRDGRVFVYSDRPEHLNLHSPKKTDLAEAYVYTCLRGASNADVGKFVGQTPSVACTTLRLVQRMRGTIYYSKPYWFPNAKPYWIPMPAPLRAIIRTVLADGVALGTGAIAAAVQQVRPSAPYESIATEIMRMRKDKLLLSRGWGSRGVLYALAPAEEQRPAVAAVATDVVLANGGAHTHEIQ